MMLDPDFGLTDTFRRRVVLYSLATTVKEAVEKFNVGRASVFKWRLLHRTHHFCESCQTYVETPLSEDDTCSDCHSLWADEEMKRLYPSYLAEQFYKKQYEDLGLTEEELFKDAGTRW